MSFPLPAYIWMIDRQTGSSAAAMVVPVVDCFTCQNVIEDVSSVRNPYKLILLNRVIIH